MSSRHAVVVSYLALFVALGGTATAIQGQHSIQSDDLATNSVGSRALAARSIRAGEIRSDAIIGRHIRNGAVGRVDLKGQSVDGTAIIDGAIRSEDLGILGRIPIGEGKEIFSDVGGITLTAGRIKWTLTPDGPAPLRLESSPGGGGGVILDGSLGPQSGYIRFSESSGVPGSTGDSASLFLRDDGSGKTQLAVVFPGGIVVPIATSP